MDFQTFFGEGILSTGGIFLEDLNKVPDKCSLVEITKSSRYGKHKIEIGNVGIFVEFVKTSTEEKEYGGLILEWFYVYLPNIGQTICVPRTEFKVLNKA